MAKRESKKRKKRGVGQKDRALSISSGRKPHGAEKTKRGGGSRAGGKRADGRKSGRKDLRGRAGDRDRHFRGSGGSGPKRKGSGGTPSSSSSSFPSSSSSSKASKAKARLGESKLRKKPVKKVPRRRPAPKKRPKLAPRKLPRRKPRLLKKPSRKLPSRKPPRKQPPKKLPPPKKPPRKLPPRRLPPKKLPLPKKPPRKLPPKELPGKRLDVVAAGVRDVIEAALADVASCVGLRLSGVQISLRVVVNSDYTVDGQLTVRSLPPRLSTQQVIMAIESCVDPVPHTWISVVLQFGPKTAEERDELERAYARWRGLFQVGTNYQRNTHGKRPLNFKQSLEIASKLEKKGREVVGIAIRLHWNRADEKPERIGGEQGAREGKRTRRLPSK